MLKLIFLVILCGFLIEFSEEAKVIICKSRDGVCAFEKTKIRKNQKVSIKVELEDLESTFDYGNVTEVYFTQSTIYAIPLMLFHTFPNLAYLDSKRQAIRKIKAKTFEKAKSLISLNLNNNLIKKLTENVFYGAENLMEIYLFNNQIDEIDRNAFNGTTKVTRLVLESNLIKVLHHQTFVNLPNLEEIRLEQNEIDYLHKRIFQNNLKLKVIHLYSNKLKQLSYSTFSHLNELEILYLKSNDCVNKDYYSPLAHAQFSEIENDLKNCTIHYQEKQIEEMSADINHLREKFFVMEQMLHDLLRKSSSFTAINYD